jgi:hypothetical protein
VVLDPGSFREALGVSEILVLKLIHVGFDLLLKTLGTDLNEKHRDHHHPLHLFPPGIEPVLSSGPSRWPHPSGPSEWRERTAILSIDGDGLVLQIL